MSLRMEGRRAGGGEREGELVEVVRRKEESFKNTTEKSPGWKGSYEKKISLYDIHRSEQHHLGLFVLTHSLDMWFECLKDLFTVLVKRQ